MTELALICGGLIIIIFMLGLKLIQLDERLNRIEKEKDHDRNILP